LSTTVGAFSISWTSVASSKNGGMLDGKTMVVVLSCVSAAGAMLAACCFYFVCCGRRRRAGVSLSLALAGMGVELFGTNIEDRPACRKRERSIACGRQEDGWVRFQQ
jgi:hypothetical protein